MKNALVILAGGKGERFGQKTPKQFYKIDSQAIINIFLSCFLINIFEFTIVSIVLPDFETIKFKYFCLLSFFL